MDPSGQHWAETQVGDFIVFPVPASGLPKLTLPPTADNLQESFLPTHLPYLGILPLERSRVSLALSFLFL